jgi:hypothetical protein
MAQAEKKITENPLTQSLDLTLLYLVTGISKKARNKKLRSSPIQGSNIFEVKVWLMSVQDFAECIQHNM